MEMNQAALIVLIVIAAAVSISVILQICAVIGLYVVGRKTQLKIHALLDDVRIHALPLISTSRGVVEDLSPKVKIIASNLVETAGNVRGMSEKASGVVGDVASRARAQAAHVDGMVQGTLDSIGQAGDTIQRGLSVPMRQFNGIVNGIRAGWSVICQKSPSRNGRDPESGRFV